MQMVCAIASLFRHQQTNAAILILFNIPCTALCNFHISFDYLHSKANGFNQPTLLCFVKDWPSITSTYKLQRLNIKNQIHWVTQYPFNFKIVTFSFEDYFEAGTFRWRQITWKISVMWFIFLTKLQAGCLQLYQKCIS